jgi:hypothetical protein
MSIQHACFAPEEITLLREALDHAWTRMSPKEQSEHTKSELAEQILKLAARGERDPVQLCDYALQKTRERAVWLEMAS